MDPARELEAVYAKRFSETEQRRNLVWQVLAKYFQQWVKTTDVVLDVGAGYCEFSNNIRAAKKLALDLNPNTEKAAGADVTVMPQDLCAHWNVADHSINVVFSSNFLEHLPNKEAVLHCLREANRVLVPGGKLILMGPNIRYCGDVYWDFFDHHIALSDRSLAEALNLADFEILTSYDKFLPFTMQGGMPAHPLLVATYLKIPLAWRILGKQFLVISEPKRA